jgi:hypothetical protein
MLAALGIPVSEVYHPIEDRIMGPAIYHFQEENSLRYGFWVLPMILTFFAEIYGIDRVRIRLGIYGRNKFSYYSSLAYTL